MSQSTSELPEAHGLVALIPRGRNGRRLGLSIGFLFAEDPIRRFGQVPGHCPDGLRVALALGDALVESTDVAVRLLSAPEGERGCGAFPGAQTGTGEGKTATPPLYSLSFPLSFFKKKKKKKSGY